jgi:hypothetical protein
MSKVGCEIMWMHYLFEEVSYDMACPSLLLLNNRWTLQVTKHLEHQCTMKHVHHAYHWICNHVNCGLITVSHVPGDLNPADIFTKPLSRVKFLHFCNMLGLPLRGLHQGVMLDVVVGDVTPISCSLLYVTLFT